jgi:cell division protein FtsZ
LSVTIISSLAAEDSIAPQTTPPKPEPFLAPPPAALEQIEEPPPPPAPMPRIDIVPEPEATPAPKGAANDLIPFEQPAAVQPPPPPPAPPNKKPAPRLIPPKKKPVLEKEVKEPKSPKEKYIYAKQEVMQFEPVTRGRFEKSEPTIVEGQDLDIPTFLRKNIKVK